jgi:hypothetical protein
MSPRIRSAAACTRYIEHENGWTALEEGRFALLYVPQDRGENVKVNPAAAQQVP